MKRLFITLAIDAGLTDAQAVAITDLVDAL